MRFASKLEKAWNKNGFKNEKLFLQKVEHSKLLWVRYGIDCFKI